MNLGKQGERLFQSLLEQQGYEVQNVSDNPDYYYKGDFIVKSPFSRETKIFECKYDSRIHKTGNLYLELNNVHSKDGIGWFNFCQADYLAYGDAANKRFYIIPLLELKERVKQLPYRQATCGDDSIGQLVALSDIQDLIQIL